MAKYEENVECGGGHVMLGTLANTAAENTGAQTSEDARLLGILAPIGSFGYAGKDLGVQCQAKYEQKPECGGGYVKLGTTAKGAAVDTGAQTSEDSKFYGISASSDSLGNAGMDLGVQCQAKYEKDVECGGGYVKLGTTMKVATAFGDPVTANCMRKCREAIVQPATAPPGASAAVPHGGPVKVDAAALAAENVAPAPSSEFEAEIDGLLELLIATLPP